MNIEQWKLKQLINKLNSFEGSGTSMITLILRPKDSISKTVKMLNDEFGTATNIKSRVNRLSVLSAITSVIQKLKNYNSISENGLCIFCGTTNTEKWINIDYIPFRAINSSLYICDSVFHTNSLLTLINDETKYGYIIVDGQGALFAVIQGTNKTIVNKFSVDLPKKHGRGGQSAVRFGRLREEKRQNYIRKVCELITQIFITNNMPNIEGLILAGNAEFKRLVHESKLFDPRLLSKVLGLLDISYGNENGLNQAIEMSFNLLFNSKIINERNILSSFMNEIAKDTRKYCFGVRDTMNLITEGCIQTLIIYEDCSIMRYETNTGIIYSKMKPENCIAEERLVYWLAFNYDKYGISLELISHATGEAKQFIEGFEGIGALLRYPVNLEVLNESEEPIDFDEDFI